MKCYKCKNCGAPLKKQGENYVCEYCRQTYVPQVAEDAYQLACKQISAAAKSALSEVVLEEKLEQIAKCRRNLYEARRREFISNEELKIWSNEIRKYNPYDVQANFFMLAASKRWGELNKYLRKINAKDNVHLLVGFVQYLTSGQFIERCILTINDMIAASIPETFAAYKQIHAIIAKGAKTANSGIFDENLPRDVFVAYSSADKEKAYDLVEYLEERGIKCYIAMRNLPKGVDAELLYNERLQRAMDNCQIFLLVSSKKSRSNTCDAYRVEMQYIREKDIARSSDENYYRNHYQQLLETNRGNCKPRVEFLIEDYGNSIYEEQVKMFFSGLSWCTNEEGVLSAVKNLLFAGPSVATTPTRNKLSSQFVGVNTSNTTTTYSAKPETAESKDFYNVGLKFFDKKDYVNALKNWEKAAELGNAKAQYNLGVCYHKGVGVAQNYKKAVDYFQKAAQQGHVSAQYNLALSYECGDGIIQDNKKAKYWYTQAAMQGDADAINALKAFKFQML